jgi:hypothetical protein
MDMMNRYQDTELIKSYELALYVFNKRKGLKQKETILTKILKRIKK